MDVDTVKLDRIAAYRDKADAMWKVSWVKRGRSVVGMTIYYLVLLSLSFVFLYPLLYMISKSLLRAQDVADATIRWVPRVFSMDNYQEAMVALDFWHGLLNSIIISFGSAALQVLSCSVIGYGFARYRFPGHSLWLAMVVFTFLVPPQTIVVPLFTFFLDLGWVNTHLPFIVPALMGHGLKGALFVLIFIQFYRRLPNVLEEAAPHRWSWCIPDVLGDYVPAREAGDARRVLVLSCLALERSVRAEYVPARTGIF